MANPAIVNLTKDTWILVAANVTAGVIHIKNFQPHLYTQTYRVTGDPGPVDDSDGAFFLGGVAIINADSPVDVYIKSSSVDGKVRVDL